MPNEDLLSEVLADFARTLATDFPIQRILDHLVGRIVDVLPIDAAGVTLISPGEDPQYVAASDESALRYEQLQTEIGEGPCLATYHSGKPVAVPDLASDTRFPAFAPKAVEAGLAAVFTFPIRHRDERVGALDLYRHTPGAMDDHAMSVAQTLADVAAAYLLNAKARSDLSESLEQSRQRALHDPLTGLPNRTLLSERLEHAVLRSRRSGAEAAVMFVDLDRFKQVNDQFGHDVGDQLLVAVAQRLTATIRPGDTLARLSGDEFVVLCEDLDGPGKADEIAARIVDAVSQPFHLAGAVTEVTASVGIAYSGPGNELSAGLLQDADTAMYQAKRKGGASHQIVDLREQDRAIQRVGLERDLRWAPARGEMRTVYQPIVATGDGRVVGFEALLRWAHPSRGMVSPAVVIPLAEQCGLITEIGRWVLEQACPDLRRWQGDSPAQSLTMAVNVSALQLMSPDYVETVRGVLESTGTDPALVTLEVTESVFVQDSERALMVLGDLKELGVRLALDDFGTGFSSLTYLQRFPIDVVKVDQAFVADLGRDAASHAIVASVIDLAHTLGMAVVAEGVETTEQHEELQELGCDECQGYLFAHPMPAANLARLVKRHVSDGAVYLPGSGSQPSVRQLLDRKPA